jgi:CubicO group peptidase (beta-lactamase class C family)
MRRAMTAAGLPGRIREAVRERIDGGLADLAAGCSVGPGTLFWAASTAKGMASTVVHVLAEHGELDYDLRVAGLWPEFAAHGKDTVTVRHLLCHTAGVPGLPPGPTRTTPATGSACARC